VIISLSGNHVFLQRFFVPDLLIKVFFHSVLLCCLVTGRVSYLPGPTIGNSVCRTGFMGNNNNNNINNNLVPVLAAIRAVSWAPHSPSSKLRCGYFNSISKSSVYRLSAGGLKDITRREVIAVSQYYVSEVNLSDCRNVESVGSVHSVMLYSTRFSGICRKQNAEVECCGQRQRRVETTVCDTFRHQRN